MLEEKRNKIRTHFRENKKTYMACGGTAVVAVVGTLLIMNHQQLKEGDKFVMKNIFSPRPTMNNVTIEMIERSTPSKPVHLVGSDRYWPSIHQTSRDTEHSVPKLSRHLNGYTPSINGDVFEFADVSDQVA